VEHMVHIGNMGLHSDVNSHSHALGFFLHWRTHRCGMILHASYFAGLPICLDPQWSVFDLRGGEENKSIK